LKNKSSNSIVENIDIANPSNVTILNSNKVSFSPLPTHSNEPEFHFPLHSGSTNTWQRSSNYSHLSASGNVDSMYRSEEGENGDGNNNNSRLSGGTLTQENLEWHDKLMKLTQRNDPSVHSSQSRVSFLSNKKAHRNDISKSLSKQSKVSNKNSPTVQTDHVESQMVTEQEVTWARRMSSENEALEADSVIKERDVLYVDLHQNDDEQEGEEEEHNVEDNEEEDDEREQDTETKDEEEEEEGKEEQDGDEEEENEEENEEKENQEEIQAEENENVEMSTDPKDTKQNERMKTKPKIKLKAMPLEQKKKPPSSVNSFVDNIEHKNEKKRRPRRRSSYSSNRLEESKTEMEYAERRPSRKKKRKGRRYSWSSKSDFSSRSRSPSPMILNTYLNNPRNRGMESISADGGETSRVEQDYSFNNTIVTLHSSVEEMPNEKYRMKTTHSFHSTEKLKNRNVDERSDNIHSNVDSTLNPSAIRLQTNVKHGEPPLTSTKNELVLNHDHNHNTYSTQTRVMIKTQVEIRKNSNSHVPSPIPSESKDSNSRSKKRKKASQIEEEGRQGEEEEEEGRSQQRTRKRKHKLGLKDNHSNINDISKTETDEENSKREKETVGLMEELDTTPPLLEKTTSHRKKRKSS